jgi:hypothetical protein
VGIDMRWFANIIAVGARLAFYGFVVAWVIAGHIKPLHLSHSLAANKDPKASRVEAPPGSRNPVG